MLEKTITFHNKQYTFFEFIEKYGVIPTILTKDHPTIPSKVLDTKELFGCWRLIQNNTFSFGNETILIIGEKCDATEGCFFVNFYLKISGTIHGFTNGKHNGGLPHIFRYYREGAVYFGSGADVEILDNGNLKISFLDAIFEEQIFEKVPNEMYSEFLNFNCKSYVKQIINFK